MYSSRNWLFNDDMKQSILFTYMFFGSNFCNGFCITTKLINDSDNSNCYLFKLENEIYRFMLSVKLNS